MVIDITYRQGIATLAQTDNDNGKELILVTGATGKVGQAFLKRFFDDPRFSNFRVRALLHNRPLEPHARLETLHGSISDDQIVNEAMAGVTHVLHLATCKETPHDIMDTAVKGM